MKYKLFFIISVCINFGLVLFIICGPITLPLAEQAKPVKKTLMPPIFDLGDIVKLPDSNQLGIVISMDLLDDQVTWRYTVQYRETKIYSNEEGLRLYKRAEWHAKVEPEIDHKSFSLNEQILP